MATERAMARQTNLFDHLRLLAATMVFISHEIGARHSAVSMFSIGLWGAWGVNIFFAISGYLNTISLLSKRSVSIFLISRAARIYPALIGCIAMTVLVGSFLTTSSWSAYWSGQTFEYFWRNSGLFFGLRQYLPGLFEHNPVTGTNASLWTLPIEARYYLYLAFGLLLLRFNRWAIGGVFAVLIAYLLTAAPHVTLDQETLRLGLIFVAGSAMAACQGLWGLRVCALAFSALAVALAVVGQGEAAFFLATAVASIVIGQMQVSEKFKVPVDISYGFYLYAFPIQQIVVSLKLPLGVGSVLALLATATAATLSALIVERPAVRAASHLKRWIAAQEPIWRWRRGSQTSPAPSRLAD
jgi:peptidoglycan/LPS O-acetylase OafA/YrhL